MYLLIYTKVTVDNYNILSYEDEIEDYEDKELLKDRIEELIIRNGYNEEMDIWEGRVSDIFVYKRSVEDFDKFINDNCGSFLEKGKNQALKRKESNFNKDKQSKLDMFLRLKEELGL